MHDCLQRRTVGAAGSTQVSRRAKRPQTCASLSLSAHLGDTWRRRISRMPRAPATGSRASGPPYEPDEASRDDATTPMPTRHPQRRRRPPARVHELAGGPLPGRLAGDDPPLDRRRATSPATGRPAASGASRRTSSTTSSPRCSTPARSRRTPRAIRARQPERADRRRSAGEAAELLAQAAVERGARQLGDRADRVDEARVDRARRAGSRRPGARRRRRPAARASGCGSSAGRPGATTSARAVSEWGAMNDTTKPSTPHAITGPPLARL